jgi:cation transport ATPase
MTIEDRLRAMARQGRGDTPPTVDVADRVVRALTSQSPQGASLVERTWMWMAGLSCVAAVAVVVVAVPCCGLWNDPFVEVVEAISWVI